MHSTLQKQHVFISSPVLIRPGFGFINGALIYDDILV
jgi:hypothetical protein